MIDQSSMLPKYYQIKEYFKQRIIDGDILLDEKLMSENEIVRKYSVSRQPVIQAFRDLEKEGWIYRIQGKGSFCARREKRHKNVGIIINGNDNYILPQIISGITAELSSSEYYGIIKNVKYSSRDEKESILEMIHMGVDGIIISPQHEQVVRGRSSEIFSAIINNNIPFLLIDSSDEKKELPFLLPDDLKGGGLAAEHLIELGHRNIMLFSPVKGSVSDNRKKGFEEALLRNGLSIHEDYYVTDLKEDDKNISADDFWSLTSESGSTVSARNIDITQNTYFHHIKRVLSCHPEITAAFCYNDIYASLMIDILKDLGKKVPEDFSVVGFDDSIISVSKDTQITTIAHPKFNYGVRAVEIVLGMIEGVIPRDHQEYMSVDLVERASTMRK